MVRDSGKEETGVLDPSTGSEANCNTQIFSLDSFERMARRPLGAHEAFLAAFGRLRAMASEPRAAVAAVAVDARGTIVAEAAIRDGAALVIGRHTRCPFRLTAPDISLRQLAAHVRVEEGTVVTRLWDLRSGHPFTTEDGVPSAAVVAEGPLVVFVREYAILFVPAGPLGGLVSDVGAERAWKSLPPREFIERRDASAVMDRRKVVAARARGGEVDGARGTRITRTSPPSILGAEPLFGPPWAEIVVSDDSGSTRYPVSVEQISRGVLFGRDERCQVEHAGDNHVSRVHLLIVRIGGEVWAIDTASTNGTEHAGEDVDAIVLADQDSLDLPARTTLWFRRLAHAGA